MTDKATLVVNGFLKLTATEKQEVLSVITTYFSEKADQQNSMCVYFGKKTASMVRRATDDPCPCCGR
jgi:hypothetical protein